MEGAPRKINKMLLIFTPQTSTRLLYICKLIFEEICGISYSLTIDAGGFNSYAGPKINYSSTFFENAYRINPHTLLFESGIIAQDIVCKNETGYHTFFPSENADHSFDIFAAAFYLISRYEEYLPHTKDMYGRYAHKNSLAFKEGFLNIPVVNIWLQDLQEKLQKRFTVPAFRRKEFKFLPSYDIDIAWSYREKGILRNVGGFIKYPSWKRIMVATGYGNDPYDSYTFLNRLHEINRLKPIYFFLVAKQNGRYDKHISPANKAMQQLIKAHADKYEIGLHPSWRSNEGIQLLKEEKDTLESIAEKKINISRQHYIKLTHPDTYQNLVKSGITDDYSMGYGSINGFRASVASSYLWYDLSAEKITSLRIHPFCFMDANCFYEENLSVEESYKQLMHYYAACKNTGGTLITIFHNNFLGTDKMFSGWKELYENFTSQVLQ